MREVVIVDTSCLILLNKINSLDILKSLYSRVVITAEVNSEYNQTIPAFINLKEVQDSALQQTLEQMLGKGESSLIALAYQFKDSLLVLDDRKARKIAKSLGFDVTGTLGILVKAKQSGIISRIKPFLDKLSQTDFRISDKVIARILEIAGEN